MPSPVFARPLLAGIWFVFFFDDISWLLFTSGAVQREATMACMCRPAHPQPAVKPSAQNIAATGLFRLV